MSLKSFHVLFIVLCAILALGSGWWALTALEGAMAFVGASAAIAACAGLALYARAFREKMKTLEAAG